MLWLLLTVASSTPLNLEDQIIDALRQEVYQKMIHSLSQKELLGFVQPEEDINQYLINAGKTSTDLNMIDQMMEKIKLDETGWDVYHTGSLRVCVFKTCNIIAHY